MRSNIRQETKIFRRLQQLIQINKMIREIKLHRKTKKEATRIKMKERGINSLRKFKGLIMNFKLKEEIRSHKSLKKLMKRTLPIKKEINLHKSISIMRISLKYNLKKEIR